MSVAHFVREGLIGGGTGDGAPARAVGRWLGLAAAPTFAVMAISTALFSGQSDMVCMAMRGSSAISGMTLMYLLMSIFHSSPWLKLIASRGSGSRRQFRPPSQIPTRRGRPMGGASEVRSLRSGTDRAGGYKSRWCPRSESNRHAFNGGGF